jgi:diguanylate cyclase (GGDEF)-like protein
VTYYQPSFGALFLLDSTDGIYANPRPGPPLALHAGDIVTVDGVTGSGDVAPVINNARFRVLGHAPLPAAPLVSFDRLSSGALDARWVTMEGIVRSIDHPSGRADFDGTTRFDSTNLLLYLASGDERLDVVTQLPSGSVPSNLIDATVRLRAAVGSRFNQRKQLTGIQAFMPNLACLQILRPAPRDPFTLPLSTATTITRASASEPGHRVRIRGIVTSTFGDQHFSLLGRDHGIFVTTQDPVSVRPGDLLDVVGFPANGDYTAYLDGALVRRLGSAPLPPPVQLSAAQAVTGVHDAEPVELDGDLAELFSSGIGVNKLRLNNAGTRFMAVLSPDSPSGSLNSLRIGSRLRLRGVCVVHTDADKTPSSFDLLLRSPADVRVLRAAPWWTPRRTFVLATTLGVLALIIFTRNLGLRHRVTTQTRQIQAQLQEARTLRNEAEAATQEKSQTLARLLTTQHDLLLTQEKLRFQATHDALTGLWNRPALVDFLHKERERALRTHAPLGILLLDIDHFKRVNDTHGHLAGDAVLREIGSRISRSVRLYDIAGRYGGEEFLILLPGCDRSRTELSAERIRTAIGAQLFHAGDAELSLTVSIGATVAFGSVPLNSEASEDHASDAVLLSRADCALYQAKSAGRNCTILRLPHPIPALSS